MLTLEEYEAKRQARYDRLIAASQKAEQEGNAARDESARISSFIPLGQPILVGHHSEKRHRRALETIRNKARKGYELHQRAEELRSRAASVEANNSIFSDDPQAVQKIESKLDSLLALQARYKAINSAHAKFLKNPASLETSGLSEDDKITVRNYKPEYSWTPHPIAPYQLTNLSANIRNAKQRAESVERKQAMEDFTETFGEIKIEHCPSENRLRLDFGKRVSLEMYKLLKQHGFRSCRDEGNFSAYYNNNSLYFLKIHIKGE